MLDNILLIIAGLAGLGAFISIFVNVLKKFGLVKEGQGEIWFQSINLVVFLAVSVVYFMKIEIDWTEVDEWLKLVTFLLGYIVQITGGEVMYKSIKGTPVVGFSYSIQEEREQEMLDRWVG